MKIRNLTIGLFLTFIASFALGRYFDSRCEKSCLFLAAQKNGGNFHISFDDDKGNPAVSLNGSSIDSKILDLPKIDQVDEIEVILMQTEFHLDVGPALTAKATDFVDDKGWKISGDGKKLTIDLSERGPDSLSIQVPAAFKNKLKIATVSGMINIGPGLLLSRLEIATASGDIFLKSWPSDTLSVNTVSGDFKNGAPPVLATKKMEFRGVSSDLTLEILSGFEDLNIQTVSGDVFLKLHGKPNFDYRLHSISGDFRGIAGGVLEEAVANREMHGTLGETKKSKLEFESISGDFKLSL